MDPRDPNYGSHPSQSIPDAAYPDDSPYRPGEGAGTPHGVNSSQVAISPVSSHQQPNSSYSPSQTSGHFCSTSILPPQPPVPNINPPPGVTPVGVTPWGAPDPRAHLIPSSPPPPYDASQAPSSYSPLGNSTSRSRSQPISDPNLQPSPPVSVHYPPSPRSPHSAHPPSPNPYSSAAGSTLENGTTKLGPVAEARRRKKRKLQICIVVLCAIFLFMIAVIVGVAVGVLKGQFKDNGGNNGGPPNNVE